MSSNLTIHKSKSANYHQLARDPKQTAFCIDHDDKKSIHQIASITRWPLSQYKHTKEFRNNIFINNWVKTDTGSTSCIQSGWEVFAVVRFTRVVLSYWWCYNWGVGGRCQSRTGLIINRGFCTVVLLSFRLAVNLLICVLQPVRGET